MRTGLMELSVPLLSRGYDLSRHVRARQVPGGDEDAIPVRMMGRPAVLVRGPEAVRLFTDTSAVRRRDAMPPFVANVLFGEGAVHGLDDATHLHRKAMFVQVLGPRSVVALVDEVSAEWARRAQTWTTEQEVSVYDEAVTVIGRAVLAWAGVQVSASEADRVARRLALIVDGFGVPGPAYVRARRARHESDQWAESTVTNARQGRPAAPQGSPLDVVASWTEQDGTPLHVHTAAVELLNLLRPTVAVARFAAFTALALAQHPSWRDRLREEQHHVAGSRPVPGSAAYAFAHEVRRLAPFVPMLVGIARRDLRFRDTVVPRGSRVVLDVVGTLRDGRYWPEPLRFRPDRFLGAHDVEPDALVPQGGGLVAAGHRCPGEDPALGILATSAGFLAALDWTVPAQDLTVSERRMPTMPRSGVRLRLSTPASRTFPSPDAPGAVAPEAPERVAPERVQTADAPHPMA
ncbi:cytochrome P450 [Pedococcus sp. 5OH_020]|uniref:cytochrome P450 n=1 Tax=Pedococcus sp. 5OH_020 TaxID=2989814 RepID=UPI0022E9A1CB|nr:cytochrome P450 [Pedococcus sp. 5OH_020]